MTSAINSTEITPGIRDETEQAIAQGIACLADGRPADAVPFFALVVDNDPNHARGHLALGSVLVQLGRPAVGLQFLERALILGSDPALVLFNMGSAHLAIGRLDDARRELCRAVAADPGNADAYTNLGIALRANRWPRLARWPLFRALCLRPDVGANHDNFGLCLVECGEPSPAVMQHQRAIIFDPAAATSWTNLGTALRVIGHGLAADSKLNRAVTLDPTLIEIHLQRVERAHALCHFDEALQAARFCAVLDPGLGGALMALGSSLLTIGAARDAIHWLARATVADPADDRIHDSLIMAMHYDPLMTGHNIKFMAQSYTRRHMEHLGSHTQRARHRSVVSRPLRLGFVSADFRWHPVGRFLAGPLRELDRDKFSVYCYANQRGADDYAAQRLLPYAEHWNVIADWPDEAVAERIAADEIDILIDLSNHTVGNRLGVFARRPAALQATWIGFPGTTGLFTMHRMITDSVQTPPDAEEYTEVPLRLPTVAWCYDPPEDMPEPAPPPCLVGDGITFGSFNNPSKLCDELLACWARILHQLPNARLLLKFRGLDDPLTRSRLLDSFNRQGVATDRIDLESDSPFVEMMAAYSRVDVALDSFPFNGGTTTCDALWMGVPVLSVAGRSMAGRLGASFLSAIGEADDLLAADVDDYIARAVALASDPDRLASLRQRLRPAMANSPLTDAKKFTRELETSLLALLEKLGPE